MKRRVVTLALFLLLGAVVNVAVATLVAQFSSDPSPSLRYAQFLALIGMHVSSSSHGSRMVYESFLDEGIGVTLQSTVLDNGSIIIVGDESIDLQFSVGWPFRSLRVQSHFRNGQWRTDSWLLPLVPRPSPAGNPTNTGCATLQQSRHMLCLAPPRN